MEKDIYPRETIQMFPEQQQVECPVDTTLLMTIPNTPTEDGMIVMALCAFSWGSVNKCLFASDHIPQKQFLPNLA